MAEHTHGSLIELVIGDDPAAWEALGFSVVANMAAIGPLRLRLVGGGEERGIRAAVLSGIDGPVDGLPIVSSTQQASVDVPANSNGVDGVDHLVVFSDDPARTVAALVDAGLDHRRTRTFDTSDGPRRQDFFWMGDVILELAGPAAAAPTAQGPATFWGLALTASDLDASAQALGERTSAPKTAVQPGRRIMTLRTRPAGVSVPVAVMSEHQPS